MNPEEYAAELRRFVHEFNNLLLLIGGHCELLTVQCMASEQAQADLAAVAQAVTRATALTAELRRMGFAVASQGFSATHAR